MQAPLTKLFTGRQSQALPCYSPLMHLTHTLIYIITEFSSRCFSHHDKRLIDIDGIHKWHRHSNQRSNQSPMGIGSVYWNQCVATVTVNYDLIRENIRQYLTAELS